MRKLVTSIILIVVGAGVWWVLSQTARLSLKKWDGKFESVLRDQLNSFGLSNQDIVSSVNEEKKDMNGVWIVHHLKIRLKDASKRDALKDELEKSGASVIEQVGENNSVMYLVKRGPRIYQEINFVK